MPEVAESLKIETPKKRQRKPLAPVKSKGYKIAEAASILNVSERTVFSLLSAHELEAYRLGKRITRITPESIDRLIASRNSAA